MITFLLLSSPLLSSLSSPLLSSPLLSHPFEKHPLFEACDGKRERLKQSASKLACQKALNQYPSSLPTQPCSPLTPLSVYPSLPFPHSSGCFPSSPSIFSRTPAHSPSCSLAPCLFSVAHFNIFSSPLSPPEPQFSPSAERRRKGAEFAEGDGRMYRQRKTDGGRSGERSSGHGWIVSEGDTERERDREREREGGYERERGPLPPSLCRRERRGRTDLSRQGERRRWRWGGREGGIYMEREREKKRQKTRGGKWSGKRFSSSLATVLFLHFIRRFTIARKFLWSAAMCYWSRGLGVCTDRQRVCVCVCVCVSQPLSVQHLFCASVAAAVSHTVS